MTEDLPDEDWTPVARSASEPVATIVLPEENFDLEDLRELAAALERAGLPVVVAEADMQRRILELGHIVIHISPTAHDLFIAAGGAAAWDGVKTAFRGLRRTGQAEDDAELTVDVEITSDRFRASAQGPAAEAVAEAARAFAERAQPET